MLKSKAKWNFIENQSMETSNQQLSISETLLIQRGITDKKAQDRFLNPQLEHIQSPEYLQGMDVACERIWKAIESGEQIIVYGDYDADGITATALLIKTLTELGAFCHYYIPHRIKDRKSTRLNSSHVAISYAVFCLKKKITEKKVKQLKVQDEIAKIRYQLNRRIEIITYNRLQKHNAHSV